MGHGKCQALEKEAGDSAPRIQGGMLLWLLLWLCLSVVLQENARIMALYEGKLKVLEAREYALVYQERDVSAKEDELRQREESLKVRERDYNQMCADLEAECWEFRRQFRLEHKVFVVCCCVSDSVYRIAICHGVMWMISRLGTTLLMSSVILLISTLAMG